ncbi:MAG TPA: DUF4390 domain-containing protein [bacterium]|nr:DUF4390 domain-containing protein [bacterium]
MFQSIVEKLAATAIAVGSVFFTTVDGTNAVFENPEIHTNGGQVVISATLNNCFTEELDRLFQSGRPVRFYFRVTLHRNGTGQVIQFNDFHHQVRYNLVDQYYQIYLSEKDQTMNAVSLEEVHRHMTAIRGYQVIDESALETGQEYYVEIRAYMLKMSLPGVKDEIDMMSYWNKTEPAIRTEPFAKEDLAT